MAAQGFTLGDICYAGGWKAFNVSASLRMKSGDDHCNDKVLMMNFDGNTIALSGQFVFEIKSWRTL